MEGRREVSVVVCSVRIIPHRNTVTLLRLRIPGRLSVGHNYVSSLVKTASCLLRQTQLIFES